MSVETQCDLQSYITSESQTAHTLVKEEWPPEQDVDNSNDIDNIDNPPQLQQPEEQTIKYKDQIAYYSKHLITEAHEETQQYI